MSKNRADWNGWDIYKGEECKYIGMVVKMKGEREGFMNAVKRNCGWLRNRAEDADMKTHFLL